MGRKSDKSEKVYADERILINKSLKEKDYLSKQRKHNIVKDRLNFYRSFIINLAHNITATYFGQDYIYKTEDIEGHYNWAFNKTCDNYKKQGVDFSDNKAIFYYFYGYFLSTLYKNETPPSFEIYKAFWDGFFSYDNGTKKDSEIDEIIEIYTHFNSTIEKRKEE